MNMIKRSIIYEKISRFAIELFINCKRCFVLSYKFNTKLRTLPFTLNSAVDNLCKTSLIFIENMKNPIQFSKSIVLMQFLLNMMIWISGEIIE